MTQLTAIFSFPPEQENILLMVLTKMEHLHEELQQARTMMRGSDILTEAEAAKELKVSVTTLRNWRREGDWLPYFNEGKLIKFEYNALMKAYKKRFGLETHYGIIEANEANNELTRNKDTERKPAKRKPPKRRNTW